MATTPWVEYQLRWVAGLRYDPDAVFLFKKEVLLPALDACHIDYSFILDEPEWVLVRVQVEDDQRKAEILGKLLTAIQGSPLFSTITVDVWSPEKDARDRITGALQRLGHSVALPPGFKGPGWRVYGQAGTQAQPGSLAIAEQPIEEKVEEFVAFITHVAGRFTEEYLRAMPRRIDDRWLKSVFVHLLLNSISTPMTPDGKGEEGETRGFPPI
jgi:hypothetical protein